MERGNSRQYGSIREVAGIWVRRWRQQTAAGIERHRSVALGRVEEIDRGQARDKLTETIAEGRRQENVVAAIISGGIGS